MTKPSPHNCWVISDGRRGIENQALGLSEALARICPLSIKRFTLTSNARFKRLGPKLQFALKPKVKQYGLADKGDPPRIVIGCGRQAIAPLLAIKKSMPNCMTVYVQDPRMNPSRFDLVIAPEHDSVSGDNVVTMIGSPNRITSDVLARESAGFEGQVSQLPSKRVAVLIGGTSKTHSLTPEALRRHISALKSVLFKGGSLMISTSRRTPDFAISAYETLANSNPKIWLHTSKNIEQSNPYFAFLNHADIILVTEDSTNMLTEACATGAPVFSLAMSGRAGKFQTLYDALQRRCCVTRFHGDVDITKPLNSYTPLDETGRVAEIIRTRLSL